MNAMQAFTPKYLKAADLNGQPHLVHIERVETRDDVLDPGSQSEVTRHILFLHNAPKGFMLNKTQTQAVVDATGESDTDNWIGQSLILVPVTNQVNLPTIEVLPIDPNDATPYAQFQPRPVRPLPTNAARLAQRPTPPTPPSWVGQRVTQPAPATTATAAAAAAAATATPSGPRRGRNQAAASTPAAD